MKSSTLFWAELYFQRIFSDRLLNMWICPSVKGEGIHRLWGITRIILLTHQTLTISHCSENEITTGNGPLCVYGQPHPFLLLPLTPRTSLLAVPLCSYITQFPLSCNSSILRKTNKSILDFISSIYCSISLRYGKNPPKKYLYLTSISLYLWRKPMSIRLSLPHCMETSSVQDSNDLPTAESNGPF